MAINQLSQNQVIQYFIQLAAQNERINTFGFGPLYDVGRDTTIYQRVVAPNSNAVPAGELVYPLMWVEPVANTLRKDSLLLRHKIHIMDIVEKDFSNRTDILSDSLRTCMELKALINKDFFYDIFPSEESNLEPFFEKYDDEVAGYSMELDLQIDWIANVCNIPGMYPSGATFVSGPTFYNVQLGSYLPLAGGELTGPLTGTSAYFNSYYSAGTPLETIIYSISNSFSGDNNFYTTGATLVGTTAFFNRNDLLSAYTLDLSSLSGGSSASLWSSSTGSNSIIANNGTGNLASGQYALVEGASNIASAIASHAEGSGTTAAGTFSHAEGYETNVSSAGIYGHAEGYSTTVLERASHAEGWNTQAGGPYGAHAEGLDTIANGQSAHAEGVSTQALGTGAHAEGGQTTAYDIYAHSQNRLTTAYGANSHAGGLSSTASGLTSFVHGTNSIAGGSDTVVFGNGVTGLTNNTVYVPYLNIKLIQSGTSVINLGLDSVGNVVTGSTGTSGAFLPLSGGTVSGGTLFQSGITANTIFVSGYNPTTPGISNAIDNNTGLMFDGPDVLSLHTGGIQRLLINAAGQITNGSHLAPSSIETYLSGDTKLDTLTAVTISATTTLFGQTSPSTHPITISSNQNLGLAFTQPGSSFEERFHIFLGNGTGGYAGEEMYLTSVNSNFHFKPDNRETLTINTINASDTSTIVNGQTSDSTKYALRVQNQSGGSIMQIRNDLRTEITGNTYLANSFGKIYSAGTPLEQIFVSSGSNVSQISSTFDGLGGVIATGSTSYLTMSYPGTFTGWYIVSPLSGSIVVDIWKASAAIPTVANSIAGTELPTLTLQYVNNDTNLTTWTGTSFVAGDVIAFNVQQCTGVTKANITLKLIK